ncbi:hypothetical protein N7530_012493 [Penicillium desertorum]|uniref:Uncharacterized protein n=1 Tax=Penicillium desertorum TaxID=1303715 RepID=A0A9W9WFH4_9EURO|nr:hypothetical protein N7530_012493 [Penicillium desertorum]
MVSRNASEFVMQVMTTGLAAMHSTGVEATSAPEATSGAAFAEARFQTVTLCPLARSARASADPINPSPSTDRRLSRLSGRHCRWHC